MHIRGKAVIIYVMGKSASGKDSIGRLLLADGELSLKPVVLYTTRPMRDGEEEGREYHFCTIHDLETFRKDGTVIEERVYHTVQGDWYYFTRADEAMCRDIKAGHPDYLAIGTLEGYSAYREYFGADSVLPVYITVKDDLRLLRAAERERRQSVPDYKELCRRYLADEEDYSAEKLRAVGIDRFFSNDGEIEECFSEVARFIREIKCVKTGTVPLCQKDPAPSDAR